MVTGAYENIVNLSFYLFTSSISTFSLLFKTLNRTYNFFIKILIKKKINYLFIEIQNMFCIFGSFEISSSRCKKYCSTSLCLSHESKWDKNYFYKNQFQLKCAMKFIPIKVL